MFLHCFFGLQPKSQTKVVPAVIVTVLPLIGHFWITFAALTSPNGAGVQCTSESISPTFFVVTLGPDYPHRLHLLASDLFRLSGWRLIVADRWYNVEVISRRGGDLASLSMTLLLWHVRQEGGMEGVSRCDSVQEAPVPTWAVLVGWRLNPQQNYSLWDHLSFTPLSSYIGKRTSK